MTALLYPIGLLALLSIIALIIIYLIKPNYQQKFISSTFVWKLSMKYRKKKLPTSRLRNLLLIICQILALTVIALILTKPVIKHEVAHYDKEVVEVIDSSSSMRTTLDNETRYERALEKARLHAMNAINEGSYVTVIQADKKATVVAEKINKENEATLDEVFDELEEESCTYNTADVTGAFDLCQQIIDANPTASVLYYTDTTFSYVPADIEVINVADENEWNGAILGATAELVDNYYDLNIDVATYGASENLVLTIEFEGAYATNAQVDNKGEEKGSFSYDFSVNCVDGKTKHVVLRHTDSGDEESGDDSYISDDDSKDTVIASILDDIYQFDYVHITIGDDEYDSYAEDNNFSIYGGEKETIKIQYASTNPNPFFATILGVLRSAYMDRFNIEVTEIAKDAPYKTKGFDFYIFEHQVPSTLPTDGIVLLADPTSTPKNGGFSILSEYTFGTDSGNQLDGDADLNSPLMEFIDANDITVKKYTRIKFDADYVPLMTVMGGAGTSADGDPVVAYKNVGDSKIVVMGFSLHYSNLATIYEWPMFMNNIFKYFFPQTVQKNYYELNDSVDVNGRGAELVVSYNDEEVLRSEAETANDGTSSEILKGTFVAGKPGTYEVNQTTYFGKELNEKVYVMVPKYESNIFGEEDGIPELYREQVKEMDYDDLLFYLAIGLVALLFLEWLLQNREGM